MDRLEPSVGDPTPCPSDDTLAALVAGGLPEDALLGLYDHADGCLDCRDLIAGLARVQRVARDAEAQTLRPEPGGSLEPAASGIEPGVQVDHYRIERQIGQGGMGRVFAAHDESLGRPVAIKVLHPRGRSRPSHEATVRLVREAQAMAQLNHENVLTVYGVGTYGGEVYFAMELVDGETLGQWTARKRRPWPLVLRAACAAGRGLAAAHRAGLVHRDFKPHNVLVDPTGRVLVTDFGLVGQADDTTSDLDSTASPSAASGEAWGDGLTKTGSVMGTVAYMAPEQVRGAAPDARADQFSFCVTLAEALYGHHPFGNNVALAASCDTWRPDIPDRADVPSAVRRILLRGLRRDPEGRFPSMEDLVGALTAIHRRRARLRWFGVAAAAAAVAAWVGATASGANAPTAELPCPRDGDGIVPGAVDATRTAEVLARFGDQNPPGAGRVATALHDYATRWQDAKHDACEATRVRGEVSEDLLDARMVCLDSRRRSLAALVDMLAGRDDVSPAAALSMVYRLPELRTCRNLRLLRELDRPSAAPAMRERLDRAERDMWRAYALTMAGDREQAIALLRPLLAEVDALGHKPLQAEVRGKLAVAVGRQDERRREALQREAYQLAMISSADDTATNLALALADGTAQAHQERAVSELWLDLARGHALRGELQIDWAIELAAGSIARAAGDRERAVKHYRAAAEAAGRQEASADQQAEVYGNLSAALLEAGRLDEAEPPLRRTIATMTQAFGPDDARTLSHMANAATAKTMLGELDEAERAIEDVLSRQRTSLGARDPLVATSLVNLAEVRRRTDRPGAAAEADRAALEIRRVVFGDDSPRTASVLRALGRDLLALGDLENAQDHLERARAGFESALGADHIETRSTRGDLAHALRLSGRGAEAAAMAASSVAGIEADTPADERWVRPLLEHAIALAEQTQLDAARSVLHRAKQMAATTNTSPLLRAAVATQLERWAGPAGQPSGAALPG
ncbi:MAG: serine/threonine-protein kinase [Myxococcota bacterium]